MITKIISGDQTGTDFGGLLAGKELGIETGGHCPWYFRTDLGSDYRLKELGLICTTSSNYLVRTRLNVAYSDGTVIFGNSNSRGSKLTIKLCKELDKPYLVISYPPVIINNNWFLETINFNLWLEKHPINILNIAGNRERNNFGIENYTKEFLVRALRET